jgi:hypothetical protein
MALAGNIGQAFEGIDQFALNPVGDCQSSFSEQITPNLPEIASFRAKPVIEIHRHKTRRA